MRGDRQYIWFSKVEGRRGKGLTFWGEKERKRERKRVKEGEVVDSLNSL